MTLIASVATRDEFILIADVLLSTSSKKDRSSLRMPLHIGPVSKEFADFGLSRMAQKLVIVDDRYSLQLAGSAIIGQFILRKLAKSVKLLRENEWLHLSQWLHSLGLSDKELSEVSLIYHHHHSILPTCYRLHHNCEEKTTQTERIIHSGTGSFDFIDNWEQRSIGRNLISLTRKLLRSLRGDVTSRFHPLVDNWFSRLGFMMLAETSIDDSGPLNYAYGGWFEIAVSDKTKFLKLPYMVKFWYIAENQIGRDLPTILNTYVDHHLVVTRVDPRGRENGQTTLHYIVDDPLMRSPAPSQEEVHLRDIDIEWQIHIVLQFDIGVPVFIVRRSNPKVHVLRSSAGWQIDFDDAFDEVLLRTRTGYARTGLVGRPYDG